MSKMVNLQLPFVSQYPNYETDTITLLSTPERIAAPTEFTGKGVTIAFVDSGFSMHPDLNGRIQQYVDASTNHIIEKNSIETTSAMSWHGQMTSVIAAGDGQTSNGRFRGIAVESQLILIKVSTPDFRIKEHDILRGLQWIHDTRHRHDIRVVNISVGGDDFSNDPDHPLHRIVRKLTEDGIIVVIAAGNSGTDHLVPPASAPHAITVGGYDDQNQLCRDDWTLYHHNYGTAYEGTPKPDILAPANWIASPLLADSVEAAEIAQLAKLLNISTIEELESIVHDEQGALKLSPLEVKQVDFKLYRKLQERINHHKIIDAHHQYVDGTSVATPIVTGVIAQMLEANENLTPVQVCNILKSTADSLQQFTDMHYQGRGVINAQAAIMAAEQA